ncbi:MAG: DUF3833 domain-containing protein [Proteobacteria bacterium]|nr:DUF3833 domain-containing protein [Pseudomonadota bacterium]
MQSVWMGLAVFSVMTFGLMRPTLAEPLKLEDYFAGETKATGSFSAINGLKRSFKVDLHGRFDGKVLTLVEDFHYADGERDRKTWRFVKTSPTTYRGTREDVVGETTVRIDGAVATFTYLVDLPGKTKPMRVRFHDRMELKEGGRLENTAIVTKWGFPVALTRVSFTRPK